ncbi:methylated-DNA--[protein]-cysteine S-methyltransferase, partial [Alkalibacterium olivapovliticus]
LASSSVLLSLGMKFLFVSASICVRLPSDSASWRTPLSFANSSYCQVCSGLSPPSYRPCRAHKKIWNSLRTIPYGETLTYSELAVKNGLSPKAARSVGSAIGKNPLLIVYPCHRVVPKSSVPRGFRGGLEMKSSLLTLEQAH